MQSSFDEAGSCPICGGAGFVRHDVPVGHPWFGRLVPCDCMIERRRDRMLRQYSEASKLEFFRDLTFEDFESDVPGVRGAYDYCWNYAQNPNGWILLIGDYGSGKTHLAAAIANYTLDYLHQSAIFVVVPDLLDQLRAAFAPDREIGYYEQFTAIREIPLLVLDDLGTENATPWAREKLFQIINHRYNMHSPTVITTNRDIDSMDGRIASRLCDKSVCQWLNLVGVKDYRQRGDQRLSNPYPHPPRGSRRSSR